MERRMAKFNAPMMIDPKSITKEHEKLIRDFVEANPNLKYIEKNTTYTIPSAPPVKIQFENPLIFTQPSKAGHQKFYVISKAKEQTLGKGAFSRAREIIGSIEIGPQNIVYQSVINKAVRVKNTQEAQTRRVRENKPAYEHPQALREYEIAKAFPHLGMEEPIEVTKDKPLKNTDVESFTKSYSVMNVLPGIGLLDAAANYYAESISTKQLINNVLIPLFEAYETQIAPTGYVHRDIKSENIRVLPGKDVAQDKALVNFLDMDSSKKIGDADSSYGTPGYAPPEVITDNCKVSPSRDIYALGVLLAETINTDIDIQEIIWNQMQIEQNNTKNMGDLFFELFGELGGSFDVDKVIKNYPVDAYSKKHGFFSHMLDNLPHPTYAYEQLKKLINEMTQMDPTKRPSIQTAIQTLKDISMLIDQHYKKEVSSTAHIATKLSQESLAPVNPTPSDNKSQERMEEQRPSHPSDKPQEKLEEQGSSSESTPTLRG